MKLQAHEIQQMNDSFNKFSMLWNCDEIIIIVKPSEGPSVNCNLAWPSIISAESEWQQGLLIDVARDFGGISIDLSDPEFTWSTNGLWNLEGTSA